MPYCGVTGNYPNETLSGGTESPLRGVSMRNFSPGCVLLAFGLVVTSTTAIAQDSQDSKPPGETPNPNPLRDARDRIYYPGDTESIKPLAKKLFGNVLLDQKEIWTSPFHMHKSDAKWWILFGAATAVLIATDRDSSTLLENSKGQVRWAQHISNIGAEYTLIPIVAGFYAYGAIRDPAKAREGGVLGAEALVDGLIGVQILKPIAARKRPDAQHEPSQFFDGGDSFPSGHTIESWALASLVAHEFGRGSKVVPIVAYSLARVV